MAKVSTASREKIACPPRSDIDEASIIDPAAVAPSRCPTLTSGTGSPITARFTTFESCALS